MFSITLGKIDQVYSKEATQLYSLKKVVNWKEKKFNNVNIDFFFYLDKIRYLDFDWIC